MRFSSIAATRLVFAAALAISLPVMTFAAQPPANSPAAHKSAAPAGPDPTLSEVVHPELPAPYNTWPGADATTADLLAKADPVRGQVVFQRIGICVSCHGWNGNGMGKNPRSEGNAAKLRDSQLDTAGLIEIVRCGIPGTPMPYHDSAAYKDDRCYGMTMDQFEKGGEPRRGKTFRENDILNVVAYIEAHIKGRPETTLADCESYFGASASKSCTNFKK